MPLHIQQLSAASSITIFKALASTTRAQILEMLGERNMNINELSQALNIAQPSVTKHIQILEDAGLVEGDYSAGVQGMQKRCRRVHDRLTLSFEPLVRKSDFTAEIEVPIGLYTGLEIVPTCGLATPEKFIGHLDDPLSFHSPERAQAQILWSTGGYVEYVFANYLPSSAVVRSIDLAMEVGSEAPGYNNDYPSDITVWINGVEIGTWMSPGDMGGQHGRLNPSWWHDYLAQYGFLKVFQVNEEGASVDGMRVSDVKVGDLKILPWQATTVRIGVKRDALHQGGFTLFGRGFGNYEQDLVLRLHHETGGGDVPAVIKGNSAAFQKI